MSYAQKLEECIDFLRGAAQEYEFCCGSVGAKDKEKSDLEHELELAAPTSKERGQVARKLQQVLKERRQYKDVVVSTQAIAEYLGQHPKLLNELAQVLGKVRKEEKYLSQRTYIPRVRKDLTIGAAEKRCKQ